MIKPNFYRDSLQLMKISDKVRGTSGGISEASVVMATETNKGILIRLGFSPSVIEKANESDMLIAVRAKDQHSIDLAVAQVDKLLESPERVQAGTSDQEKISDIDAALNKMPGANLVLLSIPGEYVKDISHKLIERGIHQQIFSDHVPVEDELEIKTQAAVNGVLILGPGAGTSIINGKGIGFSNAISMGPVGIVAAAGTGLQEVISLLDHCNIGVKHGLGVGGNDPKDKIGGIMMLECMKILEEDDDIKVVAVVSKPPSPAVERKIIDYAVDNGTKKYVLAFIGGGTPDDGKELAGSNLHASVDINRTIVKVNSLASSALAIAALLGEEQLRNALARVYFPPEELVTLLRKEWSRLQDTQRFIRALYTGGTFTYEAQVILSDIIDDGLIYSNAPIQRVRQLQDSFKSEKHSVIDLGEEEFTKGRPHPMIDPTIRKFRILEEAKDPEVGVILLDFVLGYGANPDPVGAVLAELRRAKETAQENGRHLSIVAHVCGTKNDIQGYDQSVSNLNNIGCIVMPTNALAAVASSAIVSRGQIDLARIYAKYFDVPHDWKEG
jgi:succinyl-CoA synthetase alpha subunit